jgi:hypothetical protein
MIIVLSGSLRLLRISTRRLNLILDKRLLRSGIIKTGNANLIKR